ncbi:Leucine-rich repeat-containing protein 71 isoform X2 [Aix galericulata]|nr:Leucine-rich repeat-containing protein 71 isoform X2 [Aix galericulata]
MPVIGPVRPQASTSKSQSVSQCCPKRPRRVGSGAARAQQRSRSGSKARPVIGPIIIQSALQHGPTLTPPPSTSAPPTPPDPAPSRHDPAPFQLAPPPRCHGDAPRPPSEGLEPLGEQRHGQRCVQVETEHDDPRSVREVFVRGQPPQIPRNIPEPQKSPETPQSWTGRPLSGPFPPSHPNSLPSSPPPDWSIEEEMLGVLGKCLPALPHLRALHFWRAGLTDRLLPALTALLARCPGLGTLSLEGNPLPEHSFHLLLGPGSTLSHLSLRNNGIGDEGARLLGQSLAPPGSPNLVSLVLSFNHISDLGAGHIAQGLRWNRSLLSLSLAHNEIGDAGALRLAEVLGPFALTHAEVVERRRLLLAEAMEKPPAPEGRSERAPSLQGSVATERLLLAKHSKGTAKKKVRRRAADAQDASEPSPPLLEPAWHRQGQVVLPGNRALLNLNLCREHNRITERGLAAFLARNGFPPSCPAFAQLQELLQQRDPVPRPREEQQAPGP